MSNKNQFITEARARRIINALINSGIGIESVSVKNDGVVFHTTNDANINRAEGNLGLPEDWQVCPFDDPV